MTITKKQQVFSYLHERLDEWVDGTELANMTTGGTEGLRRLREKRAELALRGWAIQMRRHPIRARATRQYRLVRTDATAATEHLCPRPDCDRVLQAVVGSEWDPRFGFGECPVHGYQQVRL